jgi:6-phosphofructokinase 1
LVDNIHKHGGTVLGTSRGPVDVDAAVEHLIRRRVDMLFCVGGDGTQRGAYALFEAAQARGHPLAVVGIPKTVDNDVPYVARTFGYLTALEESRRVIDAAHTEARSVQNGVSLVKLMGRHAGFIAAGATIASQDVNFTLVPEVPFALEGPGGLLAALHRRVAERGHAVVVLAEGAGQGLFPDAARGRDASGNVRLQDIGVLLRQAIEASFAASRIPMTLRYFDPSYLIRSRPANCEDAIMSDQFARQAVHAAMAGKSGLVVGFLHSAFIHVPTALIAKGSKRLDLQGPMWRAVLATTGQPERFV